MKRFIATIFALFVFASTSQASTDPKQTVENATFGVINELQALKVEDRTPEQVRRLVETYILPAIDQQRIAKLALGKHWKKANKEQRQAFVETFRDLQIRTYTGAFKAFNGQAFTFKDAKFNKSGKKAVVKGEMKQPGGQTIPIDFRLYVGKDQQWRIYDAVIASLGMVKTYRQQLSQQLQGSDLDTVIASMRGEIQTAQR